MGCPTGSWRPASHLPRILDRTGLWPWCPLCSKGTGSNCLSVFSLRLSLQGPSAQAEVTASLAALSLVAPQTRMALHRSGCWPHPRVSLLARPHLPVSSQGPWLCLGRTGSRAPGPGPCCLHWRFASVCLFLTRVEVRVSQHACCPQALCSKSRCRFAVTGPRARGAGPTRGALCDVWDPDGSSRPLSFLLLKISCFPVFFLPNKPVEFRGESWLGSA